jgi:4-hydroxy-tetrahydrodipicolinate synthase
LNGQYQHFLSIAQKVKIPIVLYNVPGRTGVDMPVPLYEQLSQVPNIVGVKEASTDIAKVLKIRATCGSQFHIWSGNDDLAVAAMALGAKGVISVLSNVVPKETKCMTDAALGGDFATASALQCKLLPLIDALFKEVNPIPIKAAMKMVGYDCGECRLPLGVASEKTKELLHMILKKESQF